MLCLASSDSFTHSSDLGTVQIGDSMLVGREDLGADQCDTQLLHCHTSLVPTPCSNCCSSYWTNLPTKLLEVTSQILWHIYNVC